MVSVVVLQNGMDLLKGELGSSTEMCVTSTDMCVTSTETCVTSTETCVTSTETYNTY